MKEKSVIVFVPDSLNYKQSGYLRGCKKIFKSTEVYFVTSNTPTKEIYQSVGLLDQRIDYHYNELDANISLFINITNKQVSLRDNLAIPLTQIVYDQKRFENSDIIYKESDEYGQYFRDLSKELRKSTYSSSKNGRNIIVKYLLLVVYFFDIFLKILDTFKHFIQISAIFIHFEESIRSLRCFLSSTLNEKKITPKLGNDIIAKLIDLALGIFLTTYILNYEDQIFTFINFITESIISNLKGLLLYLMGQPIGLKLNYGFNNILGQFFLYHISLWRIFLHGLYPIFTSYFKYFVLPGILGFSYQIAMVSDVVSIATFHSYCIYIYAARLFNLQLRCLTSLWRVLFGRKYNPLRNRVDSCRYSQNQLFIGTMSFTILLFLLPTTTMYYVVFSVFRLVTLSIDGLLCMLRSFMHTIPIYSICLWIVNSSSMAGNVHIIWKSFDDNGNVIIEAKLEKLPFITSVKKFTPDSVSTIKNQRTFGDIFRSSITGTIL